MDRPFLIQGHRGARGMQPENTLPAFEFALDVGANSLECDVHLSADGVPVLIHDPVLPDGSTAVHTVSAAGLVAAGVPTLAQLFQLVASYSGEKHSNFIVDVEIKTVPFRSPGPTAELIERAVLSVIQESGAVQRTWIRSFDHRVVRRMRQAEPQLTGVVLVEGMTPVDPASLVRAADAQVYAPDYRFLDEDQVRRCQSAGYRVLPWTVNDPADWERLISWGADGITTDYPDRLAEFTTRRTLELPQKGTKTHQK